MDTGDKIRALEYDPFEQKIYWTEYGDDNIGRCDLNGSNVEKYATSNSKFMIYLILTKQIDYFKVMNSRMLL